MAITCMHISSGLLRVAVHRPYAADLATAGKNGFGEPSQGLTPTSFEPVPKLRLGTLLSLM